MTQARLLDLGLRSYREVWDLQHQIHERVREGKEPETWIFVEHTPVVTLGRNAKEENLLLSREVLAARGVDVVQIERGGDVTYHGPGNSWCIRFGGSSASVKSCRSCERSKAQSSTRARTSACKPSAGASTRASGLAETRFARSVWRFKR